MPDELAENVLNILAKVKHIPREKISLDCALQDLGIDSLDTVVLLSELEDHFKISISDDAARSIRSVRDIVEGVRKLCAGAPLDSASTAD
ncbi:MAG TPA: acyl carrier protein [Candidatus Acidoferrales bacterium]|jgi:acyl carrier protein|nr:acyl carrier protein [Candidatus Acidoferrales bacterium]